MSKFIQLEQVSRAFDTSAGRFQALSKVNLTIEKGEFVAIVGKSGSGKSTLLNMLTGIDRPGEGTIVINGAALHEFNETDMASWRGRSIGIVFQFFQLIPTLTVKENILLAMDFVNKIPKVERTKRADALLESVGILVHADKLPAALSGGEQQRAALARSLANDPPILVADEPTGNLDSKTARDVYALFGALVAAGKTVIVVTHENVADLPYDRVITLADGAVVGDARRAA